MAGKRGPNLRTKNNTKMDSFLYSASLPKPHSPPDTHSHKHFLLCLNAFCLTVTHTHMLIVVRQGPKTNFTTTVKSSRHKKTFKTVATIHSHPCNYFSSLGPHSGFRPTNPGKLMWSLMIMMSPVWKPSASEPAAFVTIRVSTPSSLKTRMGKVV